MRKGAGYGGAVVAPVAAELIETAASAARFDPGVRRGRPQKDGTYQEARLDFGFVNAADVVVKIADVIRRRCGIPEEGEKFVIRAEGTPTSSLR
mgnify:CR=1 FL=1